MEFRGSAEDLQRTIHAHPTLAEALHEAALAADKRHRQHQPQHRGRRLSRRVPPQYIGDTAGAST
jgi:hypothetical protein